MAFYKFNNECRKEVYTKRDKAVHLYEHNIKKLQVIRQSDNIEDVAKIIYAFYAFYAWWFYFP